MNLIEISKLSSKLTYTFWQNKKTGEVYTLTDIAYDATNSRDGNPVAIYARRGTDGPVFVRDWGEFQEKFQAIT